MFLLFWFWNFFFFIIFFNYFNYFYRYSMRSFLLFNFLFNCSFWFLKSFYLFFTRNASINDTSLILPMEDVLQCLIFLSFSFQGHVRALLALYRQYNIVCILIAE